MPQNKHRPNKRKTHTRIKIAMDI